MRIVKESPDNSDPQKLLMTLSAYSIQGRRRHMEDFFDIGYKLKPQDLRRPDEWPYEYFYFAIFDGHGGKEAAQCARKNLARLITEQAGFWSDKDADVMKAIEQGYAETQKFMLAELPKWTKIHNILPSTAGTTASIVFIKNGKFYTGHVGDSRIVVARENSETKQWIAQQMTEDHKPESEIERIHKAGAEVRSKDGVYRVVWMRPDIEDHIVEAIARGEDVGLDSYPVKGELVKSFTNIPFLAIARSLGDFWSFEPDTNKYAVSPVPDVSCQPIHPDDKCILLATDGLWNMMHSSLAIRMLQELKMKRSRAARNGKGEQSADADHNNGEDSHEDGNEYYLTDNYYNVVSGEGNGEVANDARSLVYFAYQNWERRQFRSDNITAVVAHLNDILGHFQRSQAAPIEGAPQRQVTTTRDGFKSQEHVQICEAMAYSERVLVEQEPRFRVLDISPKYERLSKSLNDFLILPPTIMPEELDDSETLHVIQPINYLRLCDAPLRSMSLSRSSDEVALIKHVSDDPADLGSLQPTRLNSSNKLVRDASSQATQSLHDFGQPWRALKGNSNHILGTLGGVPLMDILQETKEILTGKREPSDKSKTSMIKSTPDKSESRGHENLNKEKNQARAPDKGPLKACGHENCMSYYCGILDEEREVSDPKVGADSGRDKDQVERAEEPIVSSAPKKNDRGRQPDEHLRMSGRRRRSPQRAPTAGCNAIRRTRSSSLSGAPLNMDKPDKLPQLRCVMNYTPPLRRSERFQTTSKSENSKRKASSMTHPQKAKRRKLQPVESGTPVH